MSCGILWQKLMRKEKSKKTSEWSGLQTCSRKKSRQQKEERLKEVDNFFPSPLGGTGFQPVATGKIPVPPERAG